MKESQFVFRPLWKDTKPIRHPMVIGHSGQAARAIGGYSLDGQPDAFLRASSGAALANLPAFLFGFANQQWIRPESIGDNRRMVTRLGLIALFLRLVALVFPNARFFSN